MSSSLMTALVAAGTVTVVLGAWHIGVPRFFAFRAVVDSDMVTGPDLGSLAVGRWSYRRRRSDVLGLGWVMSNAATFVLITVGVIDLAWAAGDRTIPLTVGAAWIAGWWLVRAVSQFALGRRRVDLGLAAGFATMGAIHIVAVVAG